MSTFPFQSVPKIHVLHSVDARRSYCWLVTRICILQDRTTSGNVSGFTEWWSEKTVPVLDWVGLGSLTPLARSDWTVWVWVLLHCPVISCCCMKNICVASYCCRLSVIDTLNHVTLSDLSLVLTIKIFLKRIWQPSHKPMNYWICIQISTKHVNQDPPQKWVKCIIL